MWRAERAGGDTKTPKSRRTLALPRRCVLAVREHRLRQADQAFASIGLSQADINAVRDRFASWPRTAEAAEGELNTGSPAPRSRWQRHMGSDREAGQDHSISHRARDLEPDEPEIG